MLGEVCPLRHKVDIGTLEARLMQACFVEALRLLQKNFRPSTYFNFGFPCSLHLFFFLIPISLLHISVPPSCSQMSNRGSGINLRQRYIFISLSEKESR